jgi:hypothetical protein
MIGNDGWGILARRDPAEVGSNQSWLSDGEWWSSIHNVGSGISLAVCDGLAFDLFAGLGVELPTFGDFTLVVPDLGRLTRPLGDFRGGADGP